MLSLLIFVPLLFALLVLLVPRKLEGVIKFLTLGVTGFTLAVSAMVARTVWQGGASFTGVTQQRFFQLVEKYPWIDMQLGGPGFVRIDYFVGLDGLNSTLVLLTGIVMFIGAISAFEIRKQQKGFHALYLLLTGSIFGCFAALDFFLFFLFFEFMLLPMYFLIGIWGGKRREYASIKFFLYTLLGSIFILIVMIGLYSSAIDPVQTAIQAGLVQQASDVAPKVLEQLWQMLALNQIGPEDYVHTFNLLYLTDAQNYIPGSILYKGQIGLPFGDSARLVAFLLLLIGFGIKLPVVPVHTWLPDAHVEAPTAISVVLAGILLKIGGYGILRIAYPVFPEGALHFSWWMGLFGVISIVYAAYVAMGTHNLKKLIAYSSVSHMGFVLLGIATLTSEGISGALFQMFSHGIISSMLFLVAGVIYFRTGNLEIESYKGLFSKMPVYASLVAVAFFASLGLPGFSGFIAELFVFLGAFKSQAVNQLVPMWMAVVATLGLILAAGYYLWTLQRMYLGKFRTMPDINPGHLKDVGFRELFMLLPLAGIALVLGIFPSLFLDMVNHTVSYFVDFVQATGTENLGIISGE